MSGLTPLDTCLAQALNGAQPVAPETIALAGAMGHALAGDLRLPHDLPARHEALRAGFAVQALDLMGASPQLPVPLGTAQALTPGMPLPPGTDAILPEDGTETTGPLRQAIQALNPGEGVRRAGHDGRAGDLIARAGQRLTPRHGLLAGLAGLAHLPVRRPRVHVAPDVPQAGFVRDWVQLLGALISDDSPHLTLRAALDDRPRLALAPGDTAWLARDGDALTLSLPPRFDALVAALLALGLPALAMLSGMTPASITRPLARKVTSAVGLSELVLLSAAEDTWQPLPAGSLTVTALARASAFALIPPDSEGAPAGALLAATPLDTAFG